MSPERKALEELGDFLAYNETLFEKSRDLVEAAVIAFFEDHPEIRAIKFEDSILSAFPSIGWGREESSRTAEDEKLEKCLKIFQECLQKLQLTFVWQHRS